MDKDRAIFTIGNIIGNPEDVLTQRYIAIKRYGRGEDDLDGYSPYLILNFSKDSIFCTDIWAFDWATLGILSSGYIENPPNKNGSKVIAFALALKQIEHDDLYGKPVIRHCGENIIIPIVVNSDGSLRQSLREAELSFDLANGI